jgi:glycosyltransferase involved in cell wall biosynthesis
LIIAISFTLFFIVLRFTVTLFNFISHPKLRLINRQYNDLVSILIPARNEEDKILFVLQTLSHIDAYDNFEVIVYDDGSSDRTYEICQKFASVHSQFSVIKGSKLPEGWLGKNHACYQLSKMAKGKYFLFLDADVIITDGVINCAVHRMHFRKLALLSLYPNQSYGSYGVRTVVPLVHFLLLNLIPLRLVYLFKSPEISIACGQFMLFDAVIYRQNNWHEQVKDIIAEDNTIMKLVKKRSYNGEVLLANGMIGCKTYSNYIDAVNGYSKNLLATFNNNILSLLFFILAMISGPMIIMMTLNFNLIFFMSGLIILSRVMISLSTEQNVLYNIITHPIQMINLAIIAFLSIQKHLTKTNIWKGRHINE